MWRKKTPHTLKPPGSFPDIPVNSFCPLQDPQSSSSVRTVFALGIDPRHENESTFRKLEHWIIACRGNATFDVMMVGPSVDMDRLDRIFCGWYPDGSCNSLIFCVKDNDGQLQKAFIVRAAQRQQAAKWSANVVVQGPVWYFLHRRCGDIQDGELSSVTVLSGRNQQSLSVGST